MFLLILIQKEKAFSGASVPKRLEIRAFRDFINLWSPFSVYSILTATLSILPGF